MKSEDIAKEIKSLEEEHFSLKMKRGQMEKQLVEINKRLNLLDGGPWGRTSGGLIESKKNDFEKALRKELDETRDRVVVKGKYGPEKEYVLRRITAKSIFVADPGCNSEMRFGLDGKGPYGEIVGYEEILKKHGKTK